MSIVFINFANFYRRFIQGFSKIAISLIAILKQLDHPLHQLLELMTMKLLVVVVVLELVEVLSNKKWAQSYITIWSTRRTKKVSTYSLDLRELA